MYEGYNLRQYLLFLDSPFTLSIAIAIAISILLILILILFLFLQSIIVRLSRLV
jgi:hypothetical protein